MNRRIVPALAFMSIMLFSYPVGFLVAAQDATTPTEEVVTVAPAVTEVVGVPPATAEPVATDTAPIPGNPRGGLTLDDLLPYIMPIVMIIVLAFFALLGGVIYALWKSVPAPLKPIAYPMLESGGHALINIADTYAKSTSSKADDTLVVELRQEFDTKMKALYEEMQAQRVADAKKQVESFQNALANGHLVG